MGRGEGRRARRLSCSPTSASSFIFCSCCSARETDDLVSVCFSPDGRWIAGGDYQEVKVWDAQTGQQVFALKGHRHYVDSVAFSPDGKRLLGAGRILDANDALQAGADLKVWDTQSGQEILSLQADTNRVYSVCFSVCFGPGGSCLATARWGKVRVWDAATCQESRNIETFDTTHIPSICFSPDGTRLVMATPGEHFSPGVVEVSDVQSGARLELIHGNADAAVVAGAGNVPVAGCRATARDGRFGTPLTEGGRLVPGPSRLLGDPPLRTNLGGVG
jgi:WD40 repeat protein